MISIGRNIYSVARYFDWGCPQPKVEAKSIMCHSWGRGQPSLLNALIKGESMSDNKLIQEVWDSVLVAAWWDTYSLNRAIAIYHQRLKFLGIATDCDRLDESYFHPNIKRIWGLDGEHGRRCKTVTTFMAMYIPKLNDWLFKVRLDEKRDRAWIIDQITRSGFDYQEPSKKNRTSVNSRKWDKKKQENTIKQDHIFSPHEGHRRSDWHKVK
jgi:hypothetical protein